jgi:predicted phage terminase large subunit-like protein
VRALDKLVRAELAHRELARRNYSYYLSYVNGRQWKTTRFSKYLADTVQAFIEEDTGNAYDILILETPPQHGKSTTVTEALPSWIMGRHPDWRIIIASYNDETAERFARANKDKITRFGGNLFGLQMGGVSRSREFSILKDGRPAMGKLLSRGIHSGITGNAANVLIVDDPIKNRMEADSQTFRSQIWNEWLNSLKSRLQANAKVVVIMTPWHEDDMAARILQNEDNVRLVRLPVEAEENDPLGRTPGDALCPELGKGNEWLAQFKKSYLSDGEGGPRAWSALYQCSPRAEEGNIVKREWWRYYDAKSVAEFATSVISVDATFKGGEDNDYVAIEVWGKIGNDYYLRYCLNRHMDFPETVKAIRTVRRLYPEALAVLVEDKANGSAIIQTLQKEMFCVPVNPRGGKESRVNAVSPAIESGHVYLPKGEPWLHEFVDQFTAFPAGKNDDMVDSATQALSYMLFSSGTIAEQSKSTGGNGYDELAQATLDTDALYEPYNNYY